MATFFHLLCCSIWLTTLVLSAPSPATNGTDQSPSTNVSSTPGNQTLATEPFTDLITLRLAELERLYSPDALKLYKVKTICPHGESTDAQRFTFVSIKAWLPGRVLFVETINTHNDPERWSPATETPPSSARGRPRRSLWAWAERRPLKLADAFARLRGYGKAWPMTRVSIFKFERLITWGPNDQPYWYFESDGTGNVVMGAHDEVVYELPATDLQELTLEINGEVRDENGGTGSFASS